MGLQARRVLTSFKTRNPFFTSRIMKNNFAIPEGCAWSSLWTYPGADIELQLVLLSPRGETQELKTSSRGPGKLHQRIYPRKLKDSVSISSPTGHTYRQLVVRWIFLTSFDPTPVYFVSCTDPSASRGGPWLEKPAKTVSKSQFADKDSNLISQIFGQNSDDEISKFRSQKSGQSVGEASRGLQAANRSKFVESFRDLETYASGYQAFKRLRRADTAPGIDCLLAISRSTPLIFLLAQVPERSTHVYTRRCRYNT
ncbi:hypothetical protein C8F04DRAFT_1081495 [Mycena alexandri]|uniref:Uncharacterized protein n=1 Tax=Mycena alexandri TaxID=1745969 RepID=A0AAD6T7T7_9AGAR|nr:hypothetical protein C8F04DRAFT_1081495 [Mycena alexandri]